MLRSVTESNRTVQSRPPVLWPTLPVHSSRELGWDGLVVERYQYPGGEYAIAPLPVHSIALHLGQPLPMGQMREGKVQQSLFLPHHFVVIPAGVANVCWHKESADELFISVEPTLLTTIAAAIEVDPARVELVGNFGARDPQLQYIALALLQELQSSGLGGRLFVESLTNQLAVHLLRYYAPTGLPLLDLTNEAGLSPARLQRAIAFINDQLDQELSLNDIAASVHLSPYHFTRLFKQSTGMSPHRYVIAQRVEAAKRLLANRDHTIAQVAAEVGFADHGHLARHFKRLVGVSPREFQQSKNLRIGSKAVQDLSA